MICPNCGSDIPNNVVTCPSCRISLLAARRQQMKANPPPAAQATERSAAPSGRNASVTTGRSAYAQDRITAAVQAKAGQPSASRRAAKQRDEVPGSAPAYPPRSVSPFEEEEVQPNWTTAPNVSNYETVGEKTVLSIGYLIAAFLMMLVFPLYARGAHGDAQNEFLPSSCPESVADDPAGIAEWQSLQARGKLFKCIGLPIRIIAMIHLVLRVIFVIVMIFFLFKAAGAMLDAGVSLGDIIFGTS